jgi:hypothetical protein
MSANSPTTVEGADASTTPLQITDGTLEAMKWLALALMVLDHINKWLFDAKLPGVFAFGRLVAPTFAFVLAYNLARPGALEAGMYLRVTKRLAVFALLATPPYMALNGKWWPLNIMWLLLMGVVMLYGLQRGTATWLATAGAVFVFGGLVAEYFYAGLAMILAAWWYCRSPTLLRGFLWMVSVALISMINGNAWALLAALALPLAAHLRLPVSRIRWAFYAAYPLHLSLLWAVVS